MTAAEPLFLLAFDHRSSFRRDLLGIPSDVTPTQRQRISELKMLIYDGFAAARADASAPGRYGVLVDEEYASAVARSARRDGALLAMSLERSGQAEFELEYDDDFAAHLDTFEPDYAKVLVRYNPDGDPAANHRQSERLARLSDRLSRNQRRFLFELLVPPTPKQAEHYADDPPGYDRELLPDLTVAAIEELQSGGVAPTIWKIQGFEQAAGYERAVRQAQAGGRTSTRCIVLGHGADAARVESWLRLGAATPGFDGFAIGRTIWFDPLAQLLAGHITDDAAREWIRRGFAEMVQVYTAALQQAGPTR